MILNSLFLLLPVSYILCQKPYKYNTKYIEQPVDHFSFTTNHTFQQRYLINDEYWIDGGCIFFYTGNEGNIETFAQNTGFMFDIAPLFNALIVFAEHRYYGESLPFGNESFSGPEKLGYLTSNQALADYVLLIDNLRTTYNYSRPMLIPVIAFGGSYGGMLAAWMRMKYPASVNGAIAASAPIWQFKDLVPCSNFYKIVTAVYKYSVQQDDCSKLIKKSWSAIRKLMNTTEGRTFISNKWKICLPLAQNHTDILVNWLNNIIVNMAMVNYPYATSFLAPLPPNPVRSFCYILINQNITDDKTLISAIGKALEIYTNYTQSNKCNSITRTSGNVDEFVWNFQACTEIIMPICSIEDDMFETSKWDFHAFEKDCQKTYKISQKFENYPILEYGGKDLTSYSNIVFSNGLQDPWSSGGVLHNISKTVNAVVIPEAAHHLDLRGENPLDPQSVIEARNFHKNSIKKWIREHYNKFIKEYYNKNPKVFVNNL